MNPIRPDAFSARLAAPPADVARPSAQAAFFQAALSQAKAMGKAGREPAGARAPEPAAPGDAGPAERLRRPGSLVDIRV